MRYIRLRFENDIGEVIFDNDNFHILALEGLGTPQKTYNMLEYVGYDGIFTTNSKRTSRTINIKFDIGGKSRVQDLRHIMRVFDIGGTLYLQCGDIRRKIAVSQINVDEPEDHTVISTVTAQFICDSPFFNDWEERQVSCYEVINNIKYQDNAWNLSTPTVWGELRNDKIINIDSDCETEPIFEIRVTGTTSNGGGFEILRVSDNSDIIQRLSFNYDTQDSETITINLDGRNAIGHRYAISDKNGSILNYRSDDTSLSNFKLVPGKNRIVVKNNNLNSRLNVIMRYNNNYAEAVY